MFVNLCKATTNSELKNYNNNNNNDNNNNNKIASESTG